MINYGYVSSNGAIEDLRGAWNAIWEKYDSNAEPSCTCPMKLSSSLLSAERHLCSYGQRSWRCDEEDSSHQFAAFVQIEARRNMSWAEYCTSIKGKKCWKCDRKGHKRFESPHCKKRKKKRFGDAYDDWKREHKMLRLRVEDSDESESDGSTSNVMY